MCKSFYCQNKLEKILDYPSQIPLYYESKKKLTGTLDHLFNGSPKYKHTKTNKNHLAIWGTELKAFQHRAWLLASHHTGTLGELVRCLALHSWLHGVNFQYHKNRTRRHMPRTSASGGGGSRNRTEIQGHGHIGSSRSAASATWEPISKAIFKIQIKYTWRIFIKCCTLPAVL